jgi:DNA repair exonuclease SbcCD ATPase subunit
MDSSLISHVAALEQRIVGVENSVSAIGAQINALSMKLDEKSKPQFGLLISATGVGLSITVTLGALVVTPLSRDIASSRELIKDLQNDYVTQRQHLDLITLTEKDVKALTTLVEGQIDRIRGDIKTLEATKTEKTDTAGYREGIRDRLKELDDRMTWLRTDFAQIYSAKDVIKDMQQKIERLEAMLVAGPKNGR